MLPEEEPTMTVRYLAGRIVYPDLPEAPVSTFEIWDEGADILVRGYVGEQFVSETSVRGQRLVAADFASAYARIDEGVDPVRSRDRALGMFKVPPETMALLSPAGRSSDPTGLAYTGNFDGHPVRLVLDEATGLLAEASGAGQTAIRIYFDRDEIVASAPALTPLPVNLRSERYELDPRIAAAAFGLTAIPHLSGYAVDHTLVFTTLRGGKMAEIGYVAPGGVELVARHIDEDISTTTAHGIRVDEGTVRARWAEPGAYIELEGPTADALRALARAIRPGLAI